MPGDLASGRPSIAVLNRDRAGVLPVHAIALRGFGRLEMRRQRTVLQALRHEQGRLAVCLQDEGVGAAEGGRAGSTWRGHVVRGLCLLDIGNVVAGPLAPLRIPPDVRLRLAPRL